MKARNRLGVIALLVVISLLLGACQAQQAPSQAEPTARPETTLERIKREGVVRVGFANEKPFAYATEQGTLAGEAPDIARAVFRNLGVETVDGVLTDFGSLIPGLQAGRFDAITAGMYINSQRCEQVLFAEPEYKIGCGLLVKAGNPLNLHSLEDIAANPQVRVGTGAGYLEHDYLLAVGVSEDQITLYPDNPSGVAGLQAGQIDAFVATSMAILTALNNANDPGLEMADPFTDPIVDGEPQMDYAGTAFRKGDEDLRDAFNADASEVYRAGIDAVDRGQWEAAAALNFPSLLTWVRIILPQAVPPMIPALGNYLIGMFKESSQLAAITVAELLLRARSIGSHDFRFLEPITMVGVLYFIVSYPSALVVNRLEARIGRHE
jgi:polar amino acid transport system substrate-binding protein